MKVGLQLCFSEGYREQILVYLKYLKFAPRRILKDRKVILWDEKKHLGLLEKCFSNEDIVVGNDDNESFSCVLTGTSHPHRSIEIIQNSGVFLPTSEEVERFSDNKHFVAGYLYNEDYEFVQSTRFAKELSKREVAPEILASIKNTPVSDGVWDKEYNTKFNPGCSELISYTMLMVAWKMWFGELFFELVPKERLLSFPYATEIRELPNGQIYVQLYDKIEEPFTAENVFRQWKWREWLDYDGLIEKYS